MIIRTVLAATGLFCLAGGNAFAENNGRNPGETYLISRDGNHLFRGSHRIYDRQAEGLVQVAYCGRPYWVRYATVAWTQLEVEQDYNVRVEFNRGKGWRPICDHPEEQVTLSGLGIFEDPRVVVQNGGTEFQRVSRFVVIRESFSAKAGEDAAKSFHGE